MKPEQIAKESESSHQIALFAYAAKQALTDPLWGLLFHIPNGGTRGATERDRAIAGGKLKAEGVRSGVPDLFLPVPRHGMHGLWVEMKKPSLLNPKWTREESIEAATSDSQKIWLAGLKEQGYATYVAFDWIEARDCIEIYLRGGSNN